MKKLFILLLTFGTVNTVYPCGNEYGHTLEGKRILTRYFYLSERMMHFDKDEINGRLDHLTLKTKEENAGFEVWSDISVNLMKLGYADSAITLLEPLVRDHPNEYNLMANLGTAYELTGQLDSALKYISKGYEINPQSHRGSEWIHVRILQAKVKEQQNPGWLSHHQIIDVQELIDDIDTNNLRRELRKVNYDFFYQIRTRVPFTPAPNKTISNLLVTLGDFNREVGTYENALLSYTYALMFEDDFKSEIDIKDKIKELNQQREAHPNKKDLSPIFISMMKKSEIDPNILVLGIDVYAEQLDTIHLLELAKNDSIIIMQQLLDSITQSNSLLIQAKNEEISTKDRNGYLFLLGGVLLGIGGSFLWLKKKK